MSRYTAHHSVPVLRITTKFRVAAGIRKDETTGDFDVWVPLLGFKTKITPEGKEKKLKDIIQLAINSHMSHGLETGVYLRNPDIPDRKGPVLRLKKPGETFNNSPAQKELLTKEGYEHVGDFSVDIFLTRHLYPDSHFE